VETAIVTFMWRRCKSTEAGFCEILYQNSERLELSASVRCVSRLFSTVQEPTVQSRCTIVMHPVGVMPQFWSPAD